MIKLAILIPTMPRRGHLFKRLLDILVPQMEPYKGEVCYLRDDGMHYTSIGAKRNQLMDGAHTLEAEYICFIDDDDLVSLRYVDLLMEGIAKGVDCCELWGEITENGGPPKKFHHSIIYDQIMTNQQTGLYERPPNHLNCIKRSIAERFPFPDWQRSEDSNYALRMSAANVLKTEHKIPETLYYYEYISDKKI